MRWTRQTLDRVMNLYIATPVSAEVLVDDGAKAGVSAYLAAELRHEAHPYGVELDERDCVTHFGDRDMTTMSHEAITRWRPTICAVEFVGGRADGTVTTLPRHVITEQRVRVPEAVSVSLNDINNPAPAFNVLDYELGGWDEDARRWIFTFAP